MLPKMVAPLLALFLSACEPRPFTPGHEVGDLPSWTHGEKRVEVGEPYWVIDGLGHHLFSLPSKLMLLNGRVCNHNINPRTVTRLEAYLEANHLDHVKVRVNQYAPLEEWGRLTRNTSVGWGWRYTLGVLSWLHYTLIPDRLFAGFPFSSGDHYNPYTNTIHLFSDHASIAIHEGGHARDFGLTSWKGTYAVLRLLPIVPLWQEHEATDDTFAWHRHIGETRAVKKDHKILYPAFGTYLGGELGTWVGGGYALQLPVVLGGHIIGRIHAAQD